MPNLKQNGQGILKIMGRGGQRTPPPPFPINHTCLAKTLDRLRVNQTSISSGGRGFESRSEIFSLSPCGPISFLGLILRRYYLRYLLEHFKLPHLNHYMNFDITNSVSLYRELRWWQNVVLGMCWISAEMEISTPCMLSVSFYFCYT